MAMGDHQPHEEDMTWAQYQALVEEYGEDFLVEYKDSVFFITDISLNNIIKSLNQRVAALQQKYNALLAAYKVDHPEFEEGDD